MSIIAAEWGVGQVFWSILWFTMFFIWIWLLITVFADIFRSHDIGGVAKTLWVIFIVFLPFLGVFVYLIARGRKMSEHALADAQAQEAAARQYIQQAAASPTSHADEIAKLHDLKQQGAITEEEFAQGKAKILAS